MNYLDVLYGLGSALATWTVVGFVFGRVVLVKRAKQLDISSSKQAWLFVSVVFFAGPLFWLLMYLMTRRLSGGRN